MKKTKMLVATLAVVIGLGSTAYAKLPANTVIVGNNVYDTGYLSNPSNLQKVNDELMNNLGNIYFVDNGEKAKDIFTGATVPDKQIASKVGDTLTYYRADNRVQKIVTNVNKEFQNPTDASTNTFAIINIGYKQLGNISPLYMFDVRISQLSGISDAAYFKVGNSQITAISDICHFMGQLSSGNMLSIYASDGITEIANGQINLNVSGSPSAGNQNISVILNHTASFNPADNKQHGNKAINITNTGFSAIDDKGKWIYYSNSGDKNKLYRKSVTGVDDFPISNDHAQYINVVGDWVYYSNFDDGGKIYKVRIDGTQRQKLGENKASCLNVIGDKIYYVNHSNRARVYVLDSTGDHMLVNDSSKLLSAGDNNFIFYINTSDGNKLYSYDLINNRKAKISDVNTQFLNVVNDFLIFYTGRDGKLYRATNSPGQSPIPMPVTTNIPTKSSKDGQMQTTEDKMTNIYALSDDAIYYISFADKDKIYKLDNTGNGYKVVDDSAEYINIVADKLYYSKKGKLFETTDNGEAKNKGTAIKKPKLTVKIKRLDDIPQLVTQDIDKFNFPEKVSAIMSDGTIRELVVSWNRENPKVRKGVYTFDGTVLGYNNKVRLDVALDSGIIDIDKQKPVIDNLPGNRDTFLLQGLEEGDIINLYDEDNLDKPIKTAKADKNGRVFINGLNLNPDGGNICVSITKQDRAEGAKMPIQFPAESPVGFTIDAQNETISGLKAGREYKVYLDDTKEDGQLPDIKPENAVFATVKADNDGNIKINGLRQKVEKSDNKKQALRLVLSGTVDSRPSSPIEVSQAQVPDYVSIDFNLGRIVGTTTGMEYTYSVDKDGKTTTDAVWTDCQGGTTPISLTRSLQVAIRIKPNGPVIQSEPKAYGLFPAPKVTGIEEGKIYGIYGKDDNEKKDNLPNPIWPQKQDLGNGSKVEYKAELQKDNDAPKPINDANAFKDAILTNKDVKGDIKYKLIVTATKTVPGMNPSTATNKTVINFIVNSAIPAPVEVTMIENKAEAPTTGIETYYSATPTWIDLAGTYSTPVLQRVDIGKTDWDTAAKVAFIKGTTIIQEGHYKLSVTTTSIENGSKSTSVKEFVVNRTDISKVPTVTGVYEGGIYNSTIKGVTIKDEPNCKTVATLMRDGYTTPYITATDAGKENNGGIITVNGYYVLILKTTNVKSGHTIETKISFQIDSSVTADTKTPDAPKVDFSFKDSKLTHAKIGMEYSLNGGASWNDITSEDQILTEDEIKVLNNDPNDKLMIRIKKNGETPASSPYVIELKKADKPKSNAQDKEISCEFTQKITGIECKIINTDTTNTEYSIDAGMTWHDVTDEIDAKNINEGNGIWVRTKAGENTEGKPVKASDPFKIKVVKAPAPKITVKVTDTTVNLEGTNEQMEYSIDNGSTWEEVTKEIIINSLDISKGILVRKKASGSAMPGYETKINVLKAPEAKVDYENKVITDVDDSMEWSKDGKTGWENYNKDSLDNFIKAEIVAGTTTTIYIRKKATNTSVGLTQKLEIKAPTNVTSKGLGTAGDKKITGLTAGKKYVVTVDGTKKGVKADGALGTVGEAAALTGTEITGLDNTKTYKVEEA